MIKIANEIDPENKIGCILTAGKYEKSKDIYAKVKNSNYRWATTSHNLNAFI